MAATNDAAQTSFATMPTTLTVLAFPIPKVINALSVEMAVCAKETVKKSGGRIV